MTQFIWDRYYGEVREACNIWDSLLRQHGEEGARERFWATVAPNVFKQLEPHDIMELIQATQQTGRRYRKIFQPFLDGEGDRGAIASHAVLQREIRRLRWLLLVGFCVTAGLVIVLAAQSAG